MLALDERGRAMGARFTDRYAFEGFLGHGGFAAVYRVRNLRLDRVEALKILLEARGGDPKFAARFEREARVAASLAHPTVSRVYDFGNADGTLWYSRQYVDGPTLRARLERHGRMRGEEAAGLLVPLLEALEVVHRGGIVHRDVKPDNIILDGDGRPYLMDFGILKRDDNVHETADGKILGT
ncbi:MAG: serine/threonine-protein kinase, partial [Thermoanaerobaculia bacterium]